VLDTAKPVLAAGYFVSGCTDLVSIEFQANQSCNQPLTYDLAIAAAELRVVSPAVESFSLEIGFYLFQGPILKDVMPELWLTFLPRRVADSYDFQ